MNNHTVIVITGPTASGKTPLGVSLALALKSEVGKGTEITVRFPQEK